MMNNYQKVKYNCHQATFLIEKSGLQPLSFREHIELYVHLAGCSICRTYRRQSVMIGAMIRIALYTKKDERLDEVFKDGLQRQIDEQLNNK